MNKVLWLIVLVMMAVTTLQAVQLVEVRKQNMVIGIKIGGLEDRVNYQMQLIHKHLNQPQQAEITRSDLPYMPSHDARIEYSYPIYRMQDNK